MITTVSAAREPRAGSSWGAPMLAALGLGVVGAAERNQEVSHAASLGGGCSLGDVSEEPQGQGSISAGRLTRRWDAWFNPSVVDPSWGDWVSQGRRGGRGDSKGPTC